MRLHVRHANANHIGYGRMGQEIERALVRAGVDCTPDAGTVLMIQLPMHADRKFVGQSLNCFTMFETTRLPEEFTELLHNYDTIFVPCEENRKSYAEHHDNVIVVPLGVDQNIWKPTERKNPTAERRFTFLTGGAGGHRKGYAIVVRAFLQVKKRCEQYNLPTPRLIVKCPESEPTTALENMFPDKDVIWLKELLKPADEVALYADAHCYVSGSKGEGWGLMPNQAIAQGLPTIVTDAAGQAAFRDYASYIAEWDLRPAEYGIWGPVGEWWEPREDSLAEGMFQILTNYDVYEDIAWKAAHEIPYTWDNTAKELLRHLPELPDHGPDEEPLSHKLYRVRTIKDIRADIADVVYNLRAGDDYWLPADVKRVLWGNGALTAECVAEGTGLLREQIEDYNPTLLLCPTCGQGWDQSRNPA